MGFYILAVIAGASAGYAAEFAGGDWLVGGAVSLAVTAALASLSVVFNRA